MSTVSGGGYIGATVGALFHRATEPEQARIVEERIGEGNSRGFLWWLRANGRYLIPRGPKDTMFAAALFIRNLAGFHFELGVVCVLLGAVLAGFNLAMWSGLYWAGYFRTELLFSNIRWLPGWLPSSWLIFLPWIGLYGLVVSVSFWSLPWARRRSGLFIWSAILPFSILTILAWYYLLPSGDVGQSMRNALAIVVPGLGFTWALAIPVAWYALRADKEDPDEVLSVAVKDNAGRLLRWVGLNVPVLTPAAIAAEQAEEAMRLAQGRRRVTQWLANAFLAAGAVILVGLVDRAAFYIAFEQQTVDLVDMGLLLAVAAGLLRGLMPLAARLGPGSRGLGAALLLGRVLGYALTFAICTWWVSVIYQAGLGAMFGKLQGGDFVPDFWAAVIVLCLVAIPAYVYYKATGASLGFLNQSSWHQFYQARLSRSYLGAANPRRFSTSHEDQPRAGPRGATPEAEESAAPTPVTNTAGTVAINPALEDVASTMPGRRMSASSVNNVIEGDDIILKDYAPHLGGGPIHLMNVCINQTRDPRGKLFNQDRKGLNLTVGPRGWKRESLDPWTKVSRSAGMTVAAWTAISGAAVAPGLGAESRGGLSALAAFAGARLGYWWTFEKRLGLSRDTAQQERGFMRYLMKLTRSYKALGLLNETFGVFEGVDGKDWFLTDGGHFDNTAAYALLAEQCRVIVLVDASADPDFRFGDLENVVRRARVDLDAEIEFMVPTPPPADSGIPNLPDISMFGSLNDLASDVGTACVALACVTYQGDANHQGILVYVKPNMCKGLPVDLVNFKADHPSFPHETTADQLFSEAQWESYFQLGRHLARGITQENLARVVAHLPECFKLDRDETLSGLAKKMASRNRAAAAETASDDDAPAAGTNGRMPSRIAAAAVGTTIGVGAMATVGVAVYQAIDGYRAGEQKRVVSEREAFKALTDLWESSPPFMRDREASSRAMAGNLAGALLRTADTLCPTKEARWFHESPLARKILDDAVKLCGNFRALERPYACSVLLETQNTKLRTQLSYCLADDEAPREAALKRYWLYDFTPQARVTSMHPCDPLRDDVLRAELDVVTGPLGDLSYGATKWNGGCHSRLLQTINDSSKRPAEELGSSSPSAKKKVSVVRPARDSDKWPSAPAGLVAMLAEKADSMSLARQTELAAASSSELPPAWLSNRPWLYKNIYAPGMEWWHGLARKSGFETSTQVAINVSPPPAPTAALPGPSIDPRGRMSADESRVIGAKSRVVDPKPDELPGTRDPRPEEYNGVRSGAVARASIPGIPGVVELPSAGAGRDTERDRVGLGGSGSSGVDNGGGGWTNKSCVGEKCAVDTDTPRDMSRDEENVAQVASSSVKEPESSPPGVEWGCSGIRVYIQVYSSKDFELATRYKNRMLLAGARVPPIENVNETARSSLRPYRTPVSVTRLRYHDNAARLCAESLRQNLVPYGGSSRWVVEPLSPTLKSSPGTLELWVRPQY